MLAWSELPVRVRTVKARPIDPFDFSEFIARGIRKVTTGITGLWRPSVLSDVAFWSFDVGSSYHWVANGLKCWFVHPNRGTWAGFRPLRRRGGCPIFRKPTLWKMRWTPKGRYIITKNNYFSFNCMHFRFKNTLFSKKVMTIRRVKKPLVTQFSLTNFWMAVKLTISAELRLIIFCSCALWCPICHCTGDVFLKIHVGKSRYTYEVYPILTLLRVLGANLGSKIEVKNF